MKLSGEEAKALHDAVVAACQELGGNKTLVLDCVRAVIAGVGDNFKNLEEAVDEAGRWTTDVAIGFMAVGAMMELGASFPPGDVRARLVEAGRVVGRVMAKKWAEKIEAELLAKAGIQ